MRTFITMGFIAAASFLPLIGTAQEKLVPASNSSLYADGSLCTKPDQIVFSCPLDKSRKIVSVCAAGITAPHRFYYAFGKPHAVELTYPPKNSADMISINATKQSYPSSWGMAYSFIQNGYKYIVSATEGMAFIGESGKQGLRTPYHDGILLVQKVGDEKAALEMDCASKKTYYNDKLIQESTKELKPDPDLKDGLPY